MPSPSSQAKSAKEMARPIPLTFCLSSALISPVRSFVPLRTSSRAFASFHCSFIKPRYNTMSADAAPACGLGAKGKCVPCESLDKSHILSKEAVDKELSDSLKMWKLKPLENKSDDGSEQHAISRSFTARNFQCALDAINAIGVIAERENHHPDLHLTGYRNVEIVLYTHSLGGLSINDIELAKEIDTVKVEYSPKWLKSHPEAKRE